MRTLKMAPVFLVVFALCGIPAAHADTASFSSSLTVDLTFPVINMLDVVSLNDAFLPNAVCLTQGVAAITACNNPTSTFMNSALTFTAGNVAGNAGPGGGVASGVSFGTSETIKLTNNTGADLKVQLSGTYSYSLAVMATGMAAAGAAVSFQIDERMTLDGDPMAVFGPKDFAIVAPPNATMSCASCAIPAFNIDIPDKTSVFINIDPFASGDAKVVPEPSAFIPLLSMAAAGWLRRRWFGLLK